MQSSQFRNLVLPTLLAASTLLLSCVSTVAARPGDIKRMAACQDIIARAKAAHVTPTTAGADVNRCLKKYPNMMSTLFPNYAPTHQNPSIGNPASRRRHRI